MTEPPASGAALRVAGPSSPWPVPSRGLLVVIGVAAVVLQSVIQPRVVGTTVGLSGTLSFLSLLIWTSILGGVGALLAVPASLFVKALFIDVDPDRRWLTPLLSSSAASQQPDDPVAGESPPPADPPPHVLDNPEGSRR
ncbi:MAG TPA: AI-2E family transporter [Microlunatus sp.]